MNDIDIELLEQKLTECKNTKEYKKNEIEDISNINIDVKKSSIERILDFLVRSKNPYLFKVNGIIVRFQFSDDSGLSAEDCISRAIKNEYIK